MTAKPATRFFSTSLPATAVVAMFALFTMLACVAFTSPAHADDPKPSSSSQKTKASQTRPTNPARPATATLKAIHPNGKANDNPLAGQNIEFEIKKGQVNPDIQLRVVDPEQAKRIKALFAAPVMNVKMRDVAYLGVATAPVSRELGVHLKLAEGFGLMVVHVEKDSPAAKAGLQPDDVLHKLGNQLIINTEQLGTLVRSHKKDDKIKLTFFRRGESKTVEATLAERKMPVQPKTQAFQLRNLPMQPGMFQPQPGQAKRIQLHRNLPAPVPGRFHIAPRLHMKWHDGTHELTITQKDGKKHLIAKDKQGKVLFDGPIDSDDDRKAVPDAIKPKLEKLEKSTRMQFQPFNGDVPQTIPGLKQGNADHRRLMQTLDEILKLQAQQRQPPADRAKQQADRSIDELRQRVHDDLQAQLAKLEQEIEQFKANARAAGQNPGQRLFATSLATARFSDGEHALELKVNQDGKHLIAQDNEGTVLFEGPIDTEQQRQAIPANLRGKLKTLEDSTKISVRFKAGRLTP